MIRPTTCINIFVAYHEKDEFYKDNLSRQLKILKRQDFLRDYIFYDCTSEDENDKADTLHFLQDAAVVLFLISPDFVKNNYIYDVHVATAMERHFAGSTIVVPILVREVDDEVYQGMPFAGLRTLPNNGKSMAETKRKGQMWSDIGRGILQAINEMRGRLGQEQINSDTVDFTEETEAQQDLQNIQVPSNTQNINSPIFFQHFQQNHGANIKALALILQNTDDIEENHNLCKIEQEISQDKDLYFKVQAIQSFMEGLRLIISEKPSIVHFVMDKNNTQPFPTKAFRDVLESLQLSCLIIEGIYEEEELRLLNRYSDYEIYIPAFVSKEANMAFLKTFYKNIAQFYDYSTAFNNALIAAKASDRSVASQIKFYQKMRDKNAIIKKFK